MDYRDEVERMKARKQKKHSADSSRELDIIDLNSLDYTAVEAEAPKRANKKKARKKKRILLVELLILLALIGAVFFYFKAKTDSGYWTIAVFGVDSRDGSLEKNALSDVEMICVVDKKTGEIKLVSVYRDTYLQIDADGTFHKINEAYFKGGHKQAVDALERNLDLDIDNYATFNWKAVADAINILGGIDIEISDSEFAYINSFITETVESTGVGSVHLKKSGMNHLDGVQAVAYARLRLMDTDYNRTARQRKVISLAMEKAKQADFSVLNNILVTVLPQLSTDIGLTDLLPMAQNLGKYHIGTTDGFPFARSEAKIGKKDCVVPLTLESNVIQLHSVLYGKEDFKPSSTVQKISAKIASDSGMGEVAENAPKSTTGGSSGGKAPTAAPETQAPTEVTTEESTSMEESTEESEEETEEESSEEETMEVEENPDDAFTGPGMNLKETTASHKPTPPSNEEDFQGPPVPPQPTAAPTPETQAPTPTETATEAPVPDAPPEVVAPDDNAEVGPGM